MKIPKKIIDEVAAKMLDNKIVLEDITIVPNVFLIYLHREDHADIKFLLNTLREQIVTRLNKEVSKREKKEKKDLGILSKALEVLTGLKAFGDNTKIIAPNEWDISFQATDREILVGDQTFEIRKGEICVVASFYENNSQSNELVSHLKTFVTIFKTEDQKSENFVLETAKPPTEKSSEFNDKFERSDSGRDPNALAILKYKYNSEEITKSYEMTKNKIIIGRDTGTDIILDKASNRVSRKHLEINYKNGKFYLKNFGVYGTTLQGRPVPISEKVLEDTTQEINKEAEIPDKARIALAGGEVLIDFSRLINK